MIPVTSIVVDKKGNVTKAMISAVGALVLDRHNKIYASLPNHEAWSKLPEAKIEKV